MGALNVGNRTLFTCDNLSVMQGLNSESIDLIYLDPPFNSKRNYAAPIGSQAAGAAFKDTWNLDDIKREWIEDIEADNKSTWASIVSAGHISGESTQAYLTYMAIRLIEMRRILKPTGSIYLHCDPTASHYLKLLMDAIFGQQNFRSEITWHRSAENLSNKKWRRAFETLFYYSKDKSWTWNQIFEPLSEQVLTRDYRFEDERGRYKTTACTNNAHRPNMFYEFNGNTRQWRYSKETMMRYDEEGLLVYNQDGIPRRKLYLSDVQGTKLTNVWSDIKVLASNAKEKTGYPTQKPLALLERIIEASSNPGDVVLDPFCGCATTCIAAEKLERQWIGIDIEPEARNLVIQRLEKEIDIDALFKAGGGSLPDVVHRKRPPRRTEEDAPRRSRNIKQKLYKLQGGRCAAPCGEDGQGREFPIDIFEVDHIRARNKGGPDIDENLQLLCSTCNRSKGNRTMQYLLDKLGQTSMGF